MFENEGYRILDVTIETYTENGFYAEEDKILMNIIYTVEKTCGEIIDITIPRISLNTFESDVQGEQWTIEDVEASFLVKFNQDVDDQMEQIIVTPTNDEPVSMTMDEIESALGYKINITNDGIWDDIDKYDDDFGVWDNDDSDDDDWDDDDWDDLHERINNRL